MKAQILDTNGKKSKEIAMPKILSGKIREDVVAKVIEAKKRKQPYSPSPVAGNQYSASGKIKHHRHVWKSQYGRGMSRIPRKTLTPLILLLKIFLRRTLQLLLSLQIIITIIKILNKGYVIVSLLLFLPWFAEPA